ncbi:proline-rich protein 36-like [Bacillus rossius redtenbacheri]|uniref:proline-rich protein 36-like n=1 Tax=Bacillus rossius redtenbacheri TaxID=93214 RepID=UPI002FDDC06E
MSVFRGLAERGGTRMLGRARRGRRAVGSWVRETADVSAASLQDGEIGDNMNDFQEVYESWADAGFPELGSHSNSPGDQTTTKAKWPHWVDADMLFTIPLLEMTKLPMPLQQTLPHQTPPQQTPPHQTPPQPTPPQQTPPHQAPPQPMPPLQMPPPTLPPEVYPSTTPWGQTTMKAEWSYCADADTLLTMSLLETKTLPMPLQPTPPLQTPPPTSTPPADQCIAGAMPCSIVSRTTHFKTADVTPLHIAAEMPLNTPPPMPPPTPPPPSAENATGAAPRLNWATLSHFPAGQPAAEAVAHHAMTIKPLPTPTPPPAKNATGAVLHLN